MNNYKIIPLQQEHIVKMVKAFAQIQWNKPAQLFEAYLHEQNIGERFTWVAFDNGQFLGLYVKRGYIPDGKGVAYNYIPVMPGEKYPVDDDLVLWFTKKRI